jgi:threonine aldolase
MIDLRSDTVTRPTPAMRRAMHDAEVGDDVYGEDPTVVRLQAMVAERLGKEAAMFTPSTTQSNLIAVLSHCQRGDEAIVGQQAHNYLFEGGGAACLGGVQPQPLPQEEDGTLNLEKVRALVKPDDFHFARSRLLCLENTTWGKILPDGYVERAREFADEHGLSMHLDGARIFHAEVESKTPAVGLVAPFESVSVCFSKGLGAPVGSVLVGSSEFIKQGFRWRKMLGGGMRQVGILAAAGIYALENHVERLLDDHENARRLAEGLSEIEGMKVSPVQTNMVFADVPDNRIGNLIEDLRSRDILVGSYCPGELRLVTHLDVSAAEIDTVVGAVRDFFSSE